eukprot:Gb_09113 [translate_table: standard]
MPVIRMNITEQGLASSVGKNASEFKRHMMDFLHYLMDRMSKMFDINCIATHTIAACGDEILVCVKDQLDQMDPTKDARRTSQRKASRRLSLYASTASPIIQGRSPPKEDEETCKTILSLGPSQHHDDHLISEADRTLSGRMHVDHSSCVSQQIQIPLSYTDAIIGAAGSNINYARQTSGATITIQEASTVPGEMTIEIYGTATQVQTAEQIIQVETIETCLKNHHTTLYILYTAAINIPLGESRPKFWMSWFLKAVVIFFLVHQDSLQENFMVGTSGIGTATYNTADTGYNYSSHSDQNSMYATTTSTTNSGLATAACGTSYNASYAY